MNYKKYALGIASISMIAVPVSGVVSVAAHAADPAASTYTIKDNSSSFVNVNNDKITGNAGDAPVWKQIITSTSNSDQVVKAVFNTPVESDSHNIKVSCVDENNNVIAEGMTGDNLSITLKAGQSINCVENGDNSYLLQVSDYKPAQNLTSHVILNSSLDNKDTSFDSIVKMGSPVRVARAAYATPHVGGSNNDTPKDGQAADDSSSVITYAPGDTVTATFNINNSGDEDTTVTANYLTDEAGNKVDLTKQTCTLSDGTTPWDMSMPIAAGQTVKCTINFIAPATPQSYTYNVTTEWQDSAGVGTPVKSEILFAVKDTSTPTPTPTPTTTPSSDPSSTPTDTPSSDPSSTPTDTPSSDPSSTPTDTSSSNPSSTPTDTPSSDPSSTPTDSASSQPSSNSSSQPTSNSGSNSGNSGSSSTSNNGSGSSSSSTPGSGSAGSSTSSNGSGPSTSSTSSSNKGSNVNVSTGEASATKNLPLIIGGSIVILAAIGTVIGRRFYSSKRG